MDQGVFYNSRGIADYSPKPHDLTTGSLIVKRLPEEGDGEIPRKFLTSYLTYKLVK